MFLGARAAGTGGKQEGGAAVAAAAEKEKEEGREEPLVFLAGAGKKGDSRVGDGALCPGDASQAVTVSRPYASSCPGCRSRLALPEERRGET